MAYFSVTGTTKAAAQQVAEALGADLFEIAPVEPYTADDLNWRNNQSRSTIEMHDRSFHPAVGTKVDNMAQYDRVLIGFPVWWNTCPTIINTFVESYDLSGKTLITFATSGGSTIDPATTDLRKAYPQYQWTAGAVLNSDSAIMTFVKKLK